MSGHRGHRMPTWPSRAVIPPHGHNGAGDRIPRQLTCIALSGSVKVIQSGDHHFDDSTKLCRGKVMLNYKLIASGLISRREQRLSCSVQFFRIEEEERVSHCITRPWLEAGAIREKLSVGRAYAVTVDGDL